MSTSSPRYLLDTNVFNIVFKNRLAVEEFRGVPLLVTHVQADELRATRDPATAAGLLKVFEQIV